MNQPFNPLEVIIEAFRKAIRGSLEAEQETSQHTIELKNRTDPE